MNILFSHISIAVCIVLCIVACKEEDLPPSQGMLYLSLDCPSGVSADNISIKGVGVDSMIYDSINSKTFLLPMSIIDDVFRYQINFNKDSTNAEIDFLEVYTTKEETFDNYSDGIYYIYTIDSFRTTMNAIDSAFFIYNIVDQKQYENIRLYYSVDTTAL
ncbi:MAG: DUF6452 family protein [Bacteroidales bacterium]